MKTLARITATVLIIFGILVLLSGVTLGVIGIVRATSHALGGFAPGVRVAGAGALNGLDGSILIVFVLIQGLMIIATGEGLYLLAKIANQTT